MQRYSEDELDYTTLLDDLGFYFDHPINLNRAKEGDLKALHLLSDIQIRNLFEHIEKNGKLLAIYELQSIKGYNLDLIRQILPFVKVNRPFDAPKLTFKDLIENGSMSLSLGIKETWRKLKDLALFLILPTRQIQIVDIWDHLCDHLIECVINMGIKLA